MSKAPSGRELPTQSGEGECATIQFDNSKSHAGSFRHGLRRATFLPEEGFGLVPLKRVSVIVAWLTGQ